MGVSAWSSGDNPSDAWSNNYAADFQARGGTHNPVGVANDSPAAIANTTLGALRAANGGGGGAAPAGPQSTIVQGGPFGAMPMFSNAYPLRNGTVVPQGADIGYGHQNGRGTIYRAADRSIGDMIHPASWVPGQHADAFEVYDPESGEFNKTHGFSEGEAWGSGLGTIGGLMTGVPFLGTIGALIGESADPVTPKGVETFGNIPEYEGLFGSSSGNSEMWPAWAQPRESESQQDRMGTSSPWGAAAPTLAPPPPGGTQPPEETPAPPAPTLPLPYTGDWATYGQRAEHRFF